MTKKDKKVGLIDGKLRDPPSSPNCVTTQCSKDDKTHYIKPILYKGDIEEAQEKIKNIITSLKRTKVINEKGNYMHVEFKTFLFRFVDDVEFLFDDKEKLIHFRSASRVGTSDLGVNRKRMENIRALFNKAT
jgi:uncharacterized protein (DUF1499 family)